MSCCGCASRVLKLQSEIRSWKTKLGDEKREKKMILRWISAVFGYDVEVFLEKDPISKTNGIRLQAMENKEAMSKALIKSGAGGSETEFGMMLMELKLEDHEFYEPFEEPRDVPEFPILEINSMKTNKQPPIVNTGITSFGHLSQLPNAQTLSITSPLEIKSTPLPTHPGSDAEVMYLAGNFEEGATLQGPNGQSYVIVRASEDISGQLDYSNCIVGEEVIREDNVYMPAVLPVGIGNSSNVNVLPITSEQKTALPAFALPKVPVPTVIQIEPPPGKMIVGSSEIYQTPATKSVKRKSSLSTPKQSSGKGMLIKKGPDHAQKVTNSDKSMFPSKSNNSTTPTTGLSAMLPSSAKIIQSHQQKVGSNLPSNVNNKDKESSEHGLTLREKAGIYVMQKAKESIEKVGNGFRCNVCEENRYIYSNFDTALAHAKTHFESKPYKCEHCDELFAVQREFLKHRKAAHPKPKGGVPSVSPMIQSAQPMPTTVIYADANKQLESTGSGPVTVTPVISPASYNLQTKAIMVQVPFDNNLVKGPIEISSDVLAALLGSGSPVVISQNGGGANPVTVCNPKIVLSADTINSINMTASKGPTTNLVKRAYSSQESDKIVATKKIMKRE